MHKRNWKQRFSQEKQKLPRPTCYKNSINTFQ